MKKVLSKIYLAFILFLLYAPIMTLIILSFNASKTRAKWGGFTLSWYKELFANEEIMLALYNTLAIALIASFVATVIGTLAALGIAAMKPRLKNITIGINNIPLLNSDIVTGIALMLLFIRFISLGYITILLAHITFCIPYVILNVLPRIQSSNKHIYDAALDLGATPRYAFFKVILPELLPGIVSGFLLSFTISLDDFIVTHFTKGPGVDTISTKVYTELRKGIKPEMYALSTLMFLAVLLLLWFINRRSLKKKPI